MNKPYSVCFVYIFMLAFAGTFMPSGANAVTINYVVDAYFDHGNIAEKAEILFDPSILDFNVFGAATGLLSYDGGNYTFIEDILGTTDGSTFFTIGHKYSVAGSINLELANSTALSSDNLMVWVFTEVSEGDPVYSLFADFSIPDGMWANETAPPSCHDNPEPCWMYWASWIHLQISGPAIGPLPPGDLSGAVFPVTATSYLCGDSDTGWTTLSGECAELHMTINDLNEVPLPTALWLFSSGLLGLIGVSRRKRTI